MLEYRCVCGETSKIEDNLAGSSVKCLACGREGVVQGGTKPARRILSSGKEEGMRIPGAWHGTLPYVLAGLAIILAVIALVQPNEDSSARTLISGLEEALAEDRSRISSESSKRDKEYVSARLNLSTRLGTLEERFSSVEAANGESPSKDLLARLNELEEGLKRVEAAKKSTSPETVPPNRVKWRRLKLGMTRAKVRSVLGVPGPIDVSLYSIYWYYSKGRRRDAYVIFDKDSGKLERWTEPDP